MTATGMLRPDGTVPRSTLVDRTARQAAAMLAAGVLESRTFVEVVVPRTSVLARMRLLTRVEGQQTRQEARLALTAAGLTEAARSPAPEAWREWHEELVPRIISLAVRRTDDDSPLAPLEEWQLCDDGQIRALWQRYQDLEATLDPLGSSAELTEAQLSEILDAAKKKDVGLLTSYGSFALASYAITSARQRES